MGLQRYRGESESCRIDIKIFISHEKHIILLSRPQSPKSWENHSLSRKKNGFEFRDEVNDYPVCHFHLHLIGRGIESSQSIILIRLCPEKKPPVWWIYSIAFIRKSGRHHLRYKTAKSRKDNFIIVKNQFLDHF